jgi:DNA-binding response OmpR family regulator
VLLLEPAHPEAFATAVRLLRRRAELPVICASIYPDSGQAEELRPIAYLVKPFGLAELAAALRTAVDGLTPPAELAS